MNYWKKIANNWLEFDGKQTFHCFHSGVAAGIQAYAWWKDGVQQVGTAGMTLEAALKEVDEEFMAAFNEKD